MQLNNCLRGDSGAGLFVGGVWGGEAGWVAAFYGAAQT